MGEIKGGKEIVKMFKNYEEGLEAALEKKFYLWASKLATAAQRHAPVATGQLRASIRFEVTKRGTVIVGAYGTNVKYAVFVEFGTRNIKVGKPESPRTSWPAKEKTHTSSPETMPFLRVAWAENVGDLVKALVAIGAEVKLK